MKRRSRSGRLKVRARRCTFLVTKHDVDCYSVAPVKPGAQVIVSRYAFLCTASHDYTGPDFRLIMKAIEVGDYAWVGARAFIGPGVRIGEGAVIGATASVYHDLPEWTVVAGNPARLIRRRVKASWETGSE